MSRAWLVMSLVVVGCDVPQEDFSRRYAIAMCEREVRCRTISPQSQCGAYVAHPEAERLLLQVREGYATYSSKNAVTCLEAIVEAPCAANPTLSAPCMRIASGTLQEDAGCLPGDIWRGGCAPGLSCAASQTRCPRCTRVGRTGEAPPCDYGFDVDSYRVAQTATCIELPIHKERCRSAPVLDGDPPRLQCGPELVCSNGSTCDWLVTPDPTPCSGDGGCTVPPVRPLLQPEGGKCLSNIDCALDTCRDGGCAAQLATCR